MFSLSLLMIWLLRLDPAIATNKCYYGGCVFEQLANLSCSGFDSWSEVNKEVASTKCANPPDPIYLQPNEPILLTSEMNISLSASVNRFYLYGLSGVNVYPWPFCSGCVKKYLILSISTIQFYVNNLPPSVYTCSPDLIPDDTSTSVSFFSAYLADMTINHGNTYGSLSQDVCPYLFKNAKIVSIDLAIQADSFLFISMLRFQTHTTDNRSINSIVSRLSVRNGYNYKLDMGLLHPLVFEKLTVLCCSGTLKSLQTDVFKQFAFLNETWLTLNSLGNFYHQIGIKWINYVNIGSTLVLKSEKIPYTYPDQDFCIFSEFPLNRNIQLKLDYPEQNFSLTFLWLCENGMGNSFCNDSNISIVQLNLMFKICNVTRNQTDQAQSSNGYKSYPEYYNTRIIDMLFVELVPFVFIPCVCLIGLFFNWKIIQTIHDNKKKDLKEDFYVYMSANAKFNCLYCAILVFYPMTSCNWRPSYHFCSSIFTSLFVQYYRIIMIAYFGEVFKMCANISYLMMAVNRYLLIGKDHAQWLVTVAKLEFKWVIRGSLLISVLINIGHGWQYQALKNNGITNSAMSSYTVSNGYSYSDYPFANQDLPYFIYSVLYFLVNFGVLFVVNTTIEVKIVYRMQKELKEKRKRLFEMNAVKESLSPATTKLTAAAENQLIENKKREEEDAKKERRVIKLVILNSIFNFVLRSPDILFLLNNTIMWPIIMGGSGFGISSTLGQYVPGIFSFMADIGYLTYTLTFTTNFFIFYTFNTKFKEAVVFWNTSKKSNP